MPNKKQSAHARAVAMMKQAEEVTKKRKTYLGEWYTINSILGNDWAIFYILLGGREAGKSYSAMQWSVNRKFKLGDKCKFFWMRLTDAACDNLLANGGDKLVDPDLKRKYNINTMRKNHTIYTYTPQEYVHPRSGKTEIIKTDIKEFCEVLACSTFYNTKGVGYFDNEFDGEYIFVLDEMNREESEKNSFDIVYNFVNLLENTARSTKTKIRVIMIGNTLEEASDILSAFNFIPDEMGRYKLKKKRCVIDYIRPNEKYLERRKGTIADIMLPEASTFTNELKLDRSLLVNKRLCERPQYVIKFTRQKDSWYTVWNGNIIKPYNKEEVKVVAMRKYIDEVYDLVAVNQVFDMFNARAYRFTNLACFKRFQKHMRLLKK